MGVKRPLKPQVAARYGEELSQAGKMAQMGYNPETKELNEAVYGPKTVKFDLNEEMQTLEANNIIDGSFAEALKNDQQQKGELPPMPEKENMIKNALDAVQMDQPELGTPPLEPITQDAVPAIPAPQVQPPAPVQEEQPKEESKEEEKPPTPEEMMQSVADTLKELFGANAPTLQHLKQWKAMHGNVFVLRIDERVFLYRYLKRQEWKQLLANEQWNNMSEDKREDFLATKCTLWPAFSATTQGGLPAGAAPLIAEQVKIQSLFLDASAVASITIKL